MDVLHSEMQGQLLILRLNRPEKHNCLNHELLEALQKAFISAQSNDYVRGIALFGQGKSFCAGADIARLAECDGQTGFEFARMGQSVMDRIAASKKPCIAGLHGHVLGGGLELAMACHLRFADVKTLMGQPEVKLGVIPGYGGTQRLARLVGPSRAMDMCLSGRFVHAEAALQMGLVNHVVDDVEQAVVSYLKDLLALPAGALAAVLDCIQTGYELPLSAALDLEALHFAKTCASADKKEGVAAFLEKRPAHFKGC